MVRIKELTAQLAAAVREREELTERLNRMSCAELFWLSCRDSLVRLGIALEKRAGKSLFGTSDSSIPTVGDKAVEAINQADARALAAEREREEIRQKLIDELAKNALTPTGIERLQAAEAALEREKIQMHLVALGRDWWILQAKRAMTKGEFNALLEKTLDEITAEMRSAPAAEQAVPQMVDVGNHYGAITDGMGNWTCSVCGRHLGNGTAPMVCTAPPSAPAGQLAKEIEKLADFIAPDILAATYDQCPPAAERNWCPVCLRWYESETCPACGRKPAPAKEVR